MNLRKGGEIQSTIQMLVYGAQGTGKSTMSSQLLYLKQPNKHLQVLAFDAESGGLDDIINQLTAKGVDTNNIVVVYTHSTEEVLNILKDLKNNQPLYIYDEQGDKTDEVVLDANNEPFVPDAFIIDGTTVMYTTTQIALTQFSKRRAKVRGRKGQLTSEELAVAVEGAAMEMKDWNTIKQRGQDLILTLNELGKHYVVTAREKAETESKIVNGQQVSVATGRYVVDGFKDIVYNVKTVLRLYRNVDDSEMVYAYVDKDRTGVHASGTVVEDPTLLDWQAVIDNSVGKTKYNIVNESEHAAKVEENIMTKKLIKENPELADGFTTSDSQNEVDDLRSQIEQVIATVKTDAMKKKQLQDSLKGAGFKPNDYKTLNDVTKLTEFLNVITQK